MKAIRSVLVACVYVLICRTGAMASQVVASQPAASQPAASQPAAAQSGSSANGDCCGCPAPRMVERMILVPRMSWEKRLMPCVEYTTEPRQETFTLMHAVPETKTITRQCTVMVPETRTRTENYTVCKPVPCDSSNGCGSCSGWLRRLQNGARNQTA